MASGRDTSGKTADVGVRESRAVGRPRETSHHRPASTRLSQRPGPNKYGPGPLCKVDAR